MCHSLSVLVTYIVMSQCILFVYICVLLFKNLHW